jgi:glycosyltransferase involved in cell wall biosynthesis
VVDYDDAVFHRYDMHPSFIVRAFLGHKIDRVMRNAALVIVGNEYLAERSLQAGSKNVELLPSVVDVRRYSQKTAMDDTGFTIGWIGSPVTAPYLDIIRDAVTAVASDPSIRVSLLGAGSADPFPFIPTTKLSWDEERELSIGRNFDIGIMPLLDGPFERGKCGYKLIQYMAGGLPVVASPVGVNRQIVEHGVNGYLAHSTDDWIFALRTLKHDIDQRYEMGQAGRNKAEKMYNLNVTAPKLLTLLSNV